MAARRSRDGDDETFADLVPDVKPLGPLGPGRAPPSTPRSPRRPPRPVPPFAVEGSGERMRGWVRGGDRRVLRRLRAGGIPFERSIDLHGLHSPEAHRAVQQGLEAAREEGIRCVLVIHGRGHHSEGEAVLQPALVEWLTQEPLGRFVLAFATARPEHGGSGATYILLRRTRD